MNRIVTFIIFFILQVFVLGGCGSQSSSSLVKSNTKSIDDTKYGFVQYLKDSKGEIEYAVNKANDVYSYTINTDAKGDKQLVCKLLLSKTGGIKQYSLVDNANLILTNDNVLYGNGHCIAGNSEYELKKLMDNISEFRIDKNGFNILTLTTDGKLYGWGQNRLGQVGNGTSSNTNYANEVKQPYYIIDNVKNFYIGDDARVNYYLSAALTKNGELYVWGFDKKVSNSPGFEKSIEHKIFSPEKRLDNVKSFEVRSDDLLAKTDSGEVIVNEDKIMNNQYKDMYGDNKSSNGATSQK